MRKIGVIVCVFLLLLTSICVMMGGKSPETQNTQKCSATVSQPTREWKSLVTTVATDYGVANYTELLLAMIEQESGGNALQTPDIMQSSASAGKPPNYFQTPEESVNQGVKYFSELLTRAKELGIVDTRYVVQSYNFGINFLDYVIEQQKEEFSEHVVQGFSTKILRGYGDINYVDHVYKYYICSAISNSGMIMPTESNLMNERYGYVEDPLNGGTRFHSGIDLQCSQGSSAYSVLDGIATTVSYGYNGGFGNVVIIKHSDEISTLYAHLSEIKITTGQEINQGDTVGLCGNTGASAGAHLHFEVRKDGERVDPEPFLPPLERSAIVSP